MLLGVMTGAPEQRQPGIGVGACDDCYACCACSDCYACYALITWQWFHLKRTILVSLCCGHH